jgi:Transposase family tnp2
MRYRGDFVSEENIVKDIFDGENYKHLREDYVTIGEVPQTHKFFSDNRDIALGLSLDGFCPFKRRNQTCWPLILFNYNLPPDVRFLLHNILCVGVIPGPRKPKDTDSFAYPLVVELLEFLSGIPTFDVEQDELFALHAYLIVAFGDIPAISMIMRMKGHNAIFPCRMCSIKGVRVPDTRNTTHYVPLYRANHPVVEGAADNVEIPVYDLANLPLRTHNEFLEQARHVQFATTSAEEERRAKACGIKGIPVLSHLPTLFFLSSFPFDFMHLIYENLLPNLILLWTGKFKGLDEGRESYQLGPGVWEAIGEATKASGSTIPAAYATARPQNVAEDAYACTADSWSFWALYLGPVLLKGRFRKDIYYKHFVDLIKLLRLCLQFEITKEECSEIREGFRKWVQTYERFGIIIFSLLVRRTDDWHIALTRFYYQNSPKRVSTCPLTIHALLHIADGIKAMGPVWAYWAFPMERFCGKLLRCIKSRRHPFANLDSYITAVTQLTQIENRYNAHQHLALLPPKERNSREFAFVKCECLPKSIFTFP